jgi:signal transduction histidine kinase
MPETDDKRERKLEELSSLSTHLLRLAESERSTLAKELHDELGGLITAAKMDLSWLSSKLGAVLDAESSEKLSSVMQMLNQAMILKRRVVENLRPSLLDHFGLAVALRSHFEEHCRQAGIECIAGIIARGGARHVEVVLEPEGNGYVLQVGDDGSLMDIDLTRSMPSVRHRMFAAGGTVEAEARAGQGNQIRAFVPKSAAVSA